MLHAILKKTLGLLFVATTFFAAPLFADSVSNNPIVFVSMVPNPSDFGTLAATFSNHVGDPGSAFRGGDLWIRYSDGTLKNLTSAAGFGNAGFQGAQSIAVRDPSVHWDGNKIIFSMIVGAPTQQYQVNTYRWQLYEITGLGSSQTPVVTKVSNQSSEYNNFSPTYAVDDSIIFASDRPRDSSVTHTYPQRDEYESAQTNTGLWKLNPSTGDLKILDHAPSGDFNPIIDSYGRLIFTRWDHLQRDQQNVGASMGAYNFASEASTQSIGSAPEVFPEPRSASDPNYLSTVNLFTINQFFPWMMNQDGTGLETLNHVGRQEIGLYSERSFNDDANVQEFYGQYTTGQNSKSFTIFLHIKENPQQAGTYLGTHCPEFGTHAAGQIISITGAPNVNPNDMVVTYLTHPDTSSTSNTPAVTHSGMYRDPLPLSNGVILASHTSETRADANDGSTVSPQSRYAFRLQTLQSNGGYLVANANVTTGITKSVSFWNPDQLVSYNGNLWEVMPVEVKARTRPTAPAAILPDIEASVLSEAGVNLSDLQDYLRASNLALIVSRNLTTRDKNDRQQPTNLRVSGSSTESLPKSGKVYEISHLQIFQGDLIRAYQNGNSNGRRVIAQPLTAVADGVNPTLSGAPSGAVQIAEDGSMAAFVPAGRALTWQTTGTSGNPVVRERYWLTFQPGEVRVCASCHGINTVDHLGQTPPTNPPLALARLLAHWKNLPMPTPTPPSGSSGNYKIAIKSKTKIKAGAKFTLTVTGGASSDALTLTGRVKNTSCQLEVALPTSTTKRALKGKFPKAARAKILFAVKNQNSNTSLATKKISLPASGQNQGNVLPNRVCKALMKSLK